MSTDPLLIRGLPARSIVIGNIQIVPRIYAWRIRGQSKIAGCEIHEPWLVCKIKGRRNRRSSTAISHRAARVGEGRCGVIVNDAIAKKSANRSAALVACDV